jgi:hypothetical protein
MNNQELQASWHYHNGTKHPNGYLFDPFHNYDPVKRPPQFKVYSQLEPIPLPLDSSPRGIPALAAISNDVPAEQGEQLPNLHTLARILYFSVSLPYRKYELKE